MTDENKSTIGRNEPCPCGSGKKYKRCCGVDAAPKISAPKSAFAAGAPGGAAGMPALDGAQGADLMSQMDPQMMMQVSQALQRLPRGQMQRLQSLVQRAMSGKDVSRESAEFEKTLPVELQHMLRGLSAQAAAVGGEVGAEAPVTDSPSEEEGLTEEQARELVAKAAAEGKISQEQASTLLGGAGSMENAGEPGGGSPILPPASEPAGSSRFGEFFKGLRKKK